MVRGESTNLPVQRRTMKIFYQSFLLIFFTAIVSGGCKSKKPSLAGDEPIEIADFIDFFPEAKLPYQVGDTTLLKREKDSLLISGKVFSQFVPDSILEKTFGKTARPKLYPLARVKGGNETYLFVKALSADKRVAFVLGFDKKQVFLAGMPVLRLDQEVPTQQAATIDTRFTITKTISRKNKDGSVSEGKDVYVLNNDAKNFNLIVTDALDDKREELINPIDTFSRKQKFTADYGNGKLNIVSIRDGRKADQLNFFIHFEKNNGECSGELKGEAVLRSNGIAEYHEAGDPCGLQFHFTAGAVVVKELEGCGAHRGLRCAFDGTYIRKKDLKPKPAKTKASSHK